jgi:hypothetical protein
MYSHVLPSMQKEAAAKLDKLFATLADDRAQSAVETATD